MRARSVWRYPDTYNSLSTFQESNLLANRRSYLHIQGLKQEYLKYLENDLKKKRLTIERINDRLKELVDTQRKLETTEEIFNSPESRKHAIENGTVPKLSGELCQLNKALKNTQAEITKLKQERDEINELQSIYNYFSHLNDSLQSLGRDVYQKFANKYGAEYFPIYDRYLCGATYQESWKQNELINQQFNQSLRELKGILEVNSDSELYVTGRNLVNDIEAEANKENISIAELQSLKKLLVSIKESVQSPDFNAVKKFNDVIENSNQNLLLRNKKIQAGCQIFLGALILAASSLISLINPWAILATMPLGIIGTFIIIRGVRDLMSVNQVQQAIPKFPSITKSDKYGLFREALTKKANSSDASEANLATPSPGST